MFACFSFVAPTPAGVDPHVAPRGPTQLLEPFQQCQMARLHAGRVCAYPFQETDEANSLALLRTHRERPCRCAAKQCDEIASPHGAPLQADYRTLPCWRLHCASRQIRAANVRFGSKADIGAYPNQCLLYPQKQTSLTWDVRFGSKADIDPLIQPGRRQSKVCR